MYTYIHTFIYIHIYMYREREREREREGERRRNVEHSFAEIQRSFVGSFAKTQCSFAEIYYFLAQVQSVLPRSICPFEAS